MSTITNLLYGFLQYIGLHQKYYKKVDLEGPDEPEYNFVDLELGVKPKKLKQPGMEELCFKMFVGNMNRKLMSNIGLNIGLSSLIVPLMFKLSNDNLLGINSSIQLGLFYIGMAIGCEILSTIHKNMIIEPERRKFVALIHCDLEDKFNSQVLQINWNKLRELNKNQLDRNKEMAKWYLMGFLNSSITTFISLFTFFGYLYWIGMICPITIPVYLVIMCLIVFYFPHKEKKDKNEYCNIWDKYYNKQTGLFTDIIHLQGKTTLDKMKEYICEIENMSNETKKDVSNYTDTINIVYNIAFVLNCIIVWYLVSSVADIIIYIQYSCLMRSSMISCIGLYTQYKDTKREYKKLEDIISSCVERKELEQEEEFTQIVIESLEYVYFKDLNKSNIPFRLKLQEGLVLKFKPGEIVKLEGNSGHGKSTFTDIINGIIPSSEYSSTIKLEKKDNSWTQIVGFDVLTKIRYYNEQSEDICWKPSVYEIVSGEDLKFDAEKNPTNYDKHIETMVWDALTICSCVDFLKLENQPNELKWIYTPNIGMSGGQKGRIGLARTIYRIIKQKPKFITLDEVDKSIQSEMVVGIMKSIFKYARTNGILMFVVAHTEQVKKLTGVYNQVVNFSKGIISQG